MMPRSGRIVVPGFPHHVRQQGHNGQPLFVERADFEFYLTTLDEWKRKLDCRSYAYCLMTNHVHLIVDPGGDADNLARLMKRLAGRFTRRVNRLENRTGTVWNGRYRSSPIETERYLLACCRYIELNPVRAGIVADPEEYEWSSYRAKIGRANCPWLDRDPCFVGLGRTERGRIAGYRAFVSSRIPDGEWETLRTALDRGHLSGTERFQRAVERRLGRRLELRARGRPTSAK
jgi:putative transposase